jgi:hypothetical protein
MRDRAARAALAACAVAAALGCASSAPPPAAAVPACAGLVPPALIVAGPVALPQTYVSARLAAEVVEELVVGRDGTVSGIRLVATSVPPLAPFAEASLQHGKFAPGTIEGNPVAVRGWIRMPIGGIITSRRRDPPYDSVRAFVPGGGSREALWQLAGSVDRLALAAHVGSAIAQGAAIVAVAPGGAEQTLLAIPAAPSPFDIHETVKTGRFFAGAGDYRLELRAEGKPLATSTITIAAGFETAIVNACEPLVGPEKTGPGKTPARTR